LPAPPTRCAWRWTGCSTRLKGTITELQNAIDSASAREKLAKKDKREADRLTAAADKRQLQRARELVEARFELRQAQDEEARIHRDFIDASIRAHDAELSIAERRDQVVPTDPSQRTVFQELTSRWLQALRTRSARANDLEDRRFKVIDAQIALLKRQRE
jgi:L-2-hydroxyglutarate oxidase LhgO